MKQVQHVYIPEQKEGRKTRSIDEFVLKLQRHLSALEHTKWKCLVLSYGPRESCKCNIAKYFNEKTSI